MSIWVSGDKKNGKRSLYSIGASPVLFATYTVILLMLLLPLVQFVRNLFR